MSTLNATAIRVFFATIGALFCVGTMLVGCDGSNSRPKNDNELVTPRTDCFWIEYDKEKYNFGQLDTGSTFWLAAYALPEDSAHLTIEGAFPYARFMSLITYSLVGGTIEDALADRDIVADSGSINPFVEGNPRKYSSRRYQVSVAAGPPPEERDSSNDNVLYGGPSQAGSVGVMAYRVYVPNSGQDVSGGVSLPRITLHTADGSQVQGEYACEVLAVGLDEPVPPRLQPADLYAEVRGAHDPSRNPPVFRAIFGDDFRLQCDFYGDCSGTPEKPSGGYANIGTDYMYGFFNRQFGEVLVLRGKLPETPQTLEGTDLVFMEKQLRYWSVCSYEFYSTAATDCLFDEEIVINEDGFYTLVFSRADDKPDNATAECGVGYLAWSEEGDGFGIVEGYESNVDDGYLLVRNMLPASDFTQAIQNVEVAGDEKQIMGEYLPKGKYFTRSDFEGLGCSPWLAMPYDEM